MKREIATAVCPPSWRATGRAALLLGGLLLGQALAAEAQGLITVTQVVAGRCVMETSCEWKLSCRVGNGPETQLAEYWEASVGTVMDVGKTFDIPGVPATFNCKLEEDDGWFGTSWDDAGGGTLELPGGGDYEFTVGNDEEGQLILKLRVATIEINEPAPPAPAPARGRAAKEPAAPRPRLYVGTFEAEERGHAVVIGLPWDEFKARADALTELGTKPTWMGSYEEGGTRYWSGVFHYYDGDYQIIHGLEWDPFFAKWKQLTNRQGFRLTDFEVYDEKGKILFTGLYELGSDKHNLRIGLARDEFVTEVNKMSIRGLRLIDMEVYSVQGRTLYAGAFRQEDGGFAVAAGLEWDPFMARFKSEAAQGNSFMDLESYTEGRRRLWDASITGVTGEITEPLDAKAFAAKWKEMTAKGLHLVSVETYR